MWSASIGRPSTPPLALNSLIAIIAPSRSSLPLAPYCPLASIVSPITSGFFWPVWDQTWLCFHGPKNGAAPHAPAVAATIAEAFRILRRVWSGCAFLSRSFMVSSFGSLMQDTSMRCPASDLRAHKSQRTLKSRWLAHWR